MQKIPMHMFLKGTKVFCVHAKYVFLYIVFFNYYFRDPAGCHFQKIYKKKLRKCRYLQMTVLYTKYKATLVCVDWDQHQLLSAESGSLLRVFRPKTYSQTKTLIMICNT